MFKRLLIATAICFPLGLIAGTVNASAEVFGNATLQPGQVNIQPTGIGSAEAVGDPVVSAG